MAVKESQRPADWERVPTCPQCGTTEPDDAQWCGKCYLPFAPTPSAQGFTGVVMPVAAAAPPPMAAPIPPPPAPPPPPPQYTAPLPPPNPMTAPALAGVQMVPPPSALAAAPLQRVGWQPPSGPPPFDAPPFGAQPFGAPPWGPPQPTATEDGRLLGGRALAIVALSIGIGGVVQLFIYVLSRHSNFHPDTLIRTAIVSIVVVYAVVGGLLLSQITPKVRLRWGEGAPAARVAIGLGMGAGLSGLLLWAVSSAQGHLSPDPNVLLMMSNGDTSHILIVTLLTCAAAPLVEETLFRGLLLESLRQYNTGMAVIVSAMFFAVWHFNPRGLVYYTILGALLGGIYVKRGLVASMAAHLGFNGVLTFAAISIVLGPSHSYDEHGLRFTLPGAWTEANEDEGQLQFDSETSVLALKGPDGAEIGIVSHAVTGVENLDQFAQGFGPNAIGGPQIAELPTVGRAIETKVTIERQAGEFVVFQYGGRDYLLVFADNDNRKADVDFEAMLNTLAPAPAIAPTSS